jgi:hypothetical protein
LLCGLEASVISGSGIVDVSACHTRDMSGGTERGNW